MLFELINPSDAITMEAETHEAACVACCCLGCGNYALRGLDTALECPMFIFNDPDEWFTKEFGATFSECMERSRLAAAKAMSKVKYKSRRTSLNNIGANAKGWAKRLKEWNPDKTREVLK